MQALASRTFTSILLLSACAGAGDAPKEVEPPAVAAAPPAAHDYRCDSGETITATYPSTDSATVHYKRQSHPMQIAVSASGARYVGGELEWWTKGSGAGSEGTLFRHLADGTSGESLERCTES
ncbi:MAG TPA: MliC family protein [Gemmatimonadales bacterium]|nr:MliC family protein [Gemmatimonadales bacterium]